MYRHLYRREISTINIPSKFWKVLNLSFLIIVGNIEALRHRTFLKNEDVLVFVQ